MTLNSHNGDRSPAALPADLYRLSADEALRELDAPRAGLTGPEAAARRARFGPNALKARNKTPLVVLFLRQLANPLAYILMAAALVKLLVKGVLDAAVIGAVLGLMAVIGFVQELAVIQSAERWKRAGLFSD